MSHVIILAGSAQEANRYIRAAILPRGRAIYAYTPSVVDGVVPSEVHILPGHRKRRDQHAVMANVKRASRRYQGVKFVEIDERGPLTLRNLEIAHRYNRLREDAPASTLPVEPASEPEDTSNGGNMEAEGAPAVRRRSRCKDCGNLHFKDEPCPDLNDIFGED